ncbi:Transcriptional regulatory protein BaeR [Lentibacillus sp. JNUCC-1]|uniref:response regulator transcription factor n=1 Tax=Lentibacillus sp. JNUCC-1 TaxID=2654513 RepID=UPI0012E97CB5|nr:response regulator transcription factor [Lentibacillus sp. JNUCC-1]MUV38464.1 Transcriptional regulatory protein BaeR [Lentibacillus sp. JNUCC-1]
MKKQIGIVEDDPNIGNIVSAYLKKEGFDVSLSQSAEAAWTLWETNPPDMWILDIMLPGMDGYEFCKRVRQSSEIPIIIISAKDEEIDKILGLELGGDDYMTKPFSPRELVARVKRLFKRTQATASSSDSEGEKVSAGPLVIDLNERLVFWYDEEIEMTTKEFDLLTLFAEHPNRAYSREELLYKVWGSDYFGSDRAVDDLVKRLRKKLPEVTLETVWGYGYRLRSEED